MAMTTSSKEYFEEFEKRVRELDAEDVSVLASGISLMWVPIYRNFCRVNSLLDMEALLDESRQYLLDCVRVDRFRNGKHISELLYDADDYTLVYTPWVLDSGTLISLAIGREFKLYESIEYFIDRMDSLNAEKILPKDKITKAFLYDDLDLHCDILDIFKLHENFLIKAIDREEYLSKSDKFQLESLLD